MHRFSLGVMACLMVALGLTQNVHGQAQSWRRNPFQRFVYRQGQGWGVQVNGNWEPLVLQSQAQSTQQATLNQILQKLTNLERQVAALQAGGQRQGGLQAVSGIWDYDRPRERHTFEFHDDGTYDEYFRERRVNGFLSTRRKNSTTGRYVWDARSSSILLQPGTGGTRRLKIEIASDHKHLNITEGSQPTCTYERHH